MKFSKTEEQEIESTFKRTMEVIKELYDSSDLEIYKKNVILHDNVSYRFEINQYGIWLTYQFAPNGNCVAGFKRNGKVHLYKNPTILMFRFLNKYDDIREDLEKTALDNLNRKQAGLNKIRELQNKYTKEATIEIIMPETVNQSSIEVTQEDGKNVGVLSIGPISLKILTSPNVVIKGSKPKTKQKMRGE